MFNEESIREAIMESIALGEGFDNEHYSGVRIIAEQPDSRVTGACIMPGDEWEGRDGYLFVRQHRPEFERVAFIPYESIIAVECRTSR
jgi:hypothetical protein